MKVSIVIPYYNRKQLLLNTLQSINHFNKGCDLETIIVDDGSDIEHQIDSIAVSFPSLNIILVKIKRAVGWRGACIAYNTGFKMTTGDIVLINSAECIHVGDILGYVLKNFKHDSYISFATYAGDVELNDRINKLQWNDPLLLKKMLRIIGAFPNWWHSHSQPEKSKETYIPFCAAISKDNMRRLSGYDERFAIGVGYDDYDFTDRVKNMKLDISLVDKPFVVHQWHEPTVYFNRVNYRLLKKIRILDPRRIKAKHNTIYAT